MYGDGVKESEWHISYILKSKACNIKSFLRPYK